MIARVWRGTTCAVLLGLTFVSSSVSAATIVVTSATIVSAFNKANAGDTLRLVGTFGETKLIGRSFSRVVTLDASKALFTNTLNLTRDSNLKISGGTFDVTGGSAYNHAAVIYGGSNIVFDRSHALGVGNQGGLSFEGTSNVTVSNGSFDGFHDAVAFDAVTNGVATRNTIKHAEADGIDIGDSHFVTASYNNCSLGVPGAGVHPDCIQLWSLTGQPVESDITVTHNSATGPTQGFTSFSAGGGALRVAITHNTVASSYPQGVACYDCVDSTISYNTVSTLPGARWLTNINVLGGTGNTVVGNVIRAAPWLGHAPVATATAVFAPALAAASLSNVVSGSPSGVPEPATWALLVTGFAAVGAVRRRTARAGRIALAA